MALRRPSEPGRRSTGTLSSKEDQHFHLRGKNPNWGGFSWSRQVRLPPYRLLDSGKRRKVGKRLSLRKEKTDRGQRTEKKDRTSSFWKSLCCPTPRRWDPVCPGGRRLSSRKSPKRRGGLIGKKGESARAEKGGTQKGRVLLSAEKEKGKSNVPRKGGKSSDRKSLAGGGNIRKIGV